MTKQDAIKAFGSGAALARALGITRGGGFAVAYGVGPSAD